MVVYDGHMPKQRKRRRKPTAAGVIVGAASLVVSLAIIGGGYLLIILWLKEVSTSLAGILLWIGTLPLVIAVIWLTVTLMDVFEKLTGTSLRTQSSSDDATSNDSI